MSEPVVFRLAATGQVKDDQINAFTTSTLEEDLGSIPKCGPACQKALTEAGITTSFQLLGKFLTFKDKGDDTQAHLTKFCEWLASIE